MSDIMFFSIKYDYECEKYCKKKIPCKMMLLGTEEDDLTKCVLPTLCVGGL
jgi:hypothetical protein